MCHTREISNSIPRETFHSDTAISSAASSEYETRGVQGWGSVETKLPLGIIEGPIKKTYCGHGRSLCGYKVIVETNLIYPGRWSCLEMIYLPGSGKQPLLSRFNVVASFISKWPRLDLCEQRPRLRFNPFSSQRKREIYFSTTANNRLTKHHINLQVHLIVGKLNAALSPGWINISNWPGLTTSNPANLLKVLECRIEYLNKSENTA